MNTPFFIAKRYLFAKKSTNAINIISAISMAGVFVGSAALVIILSVFNGFEHMVLKMFNSFTPTVIISPAEGKTFDPSLPFFKQLKTDPSVLSYEEVLFENAVLKYGDRQAVGIIKGVNSSYQERMALDSIMISGKFDLKRDEVSTIVLGSTLQNYLMVQPIDGTSSLQLFSPNKSANLNSVTGLANFNIEDAYVAGVFEVQQEFDNTAIVTLDLARALFSEPSKVSQIEINLKEELNDEAFVKSAKNELGDKFLVKNRLEQNKALYNVLSSEKWMVFIILTFILVIAIFNIIGSLTMLVIEKRQDIQILSSLGATNNWIKKIFLIEGMMITLSGCIAGLIVGLIFCVLQQNFGLISLGDAGSLSSRPYPIQLKLWDFVLVFLTISSLSFIASAISANLSVKNIDQLKSAY